jgi:hypothetical protein
MINSVIFIHTFFKFLVNSDYWRAFGFLNVWTISGLKDFLNDVQSPAVSITLINLVEIGHTSIKHSAFNE